jgi:hypothetical protein
LRTPKDQSKYALGNPKPVADPYLYFVRQHFEGCQGTMQRDLVRMKLRLVGE